MSNPITDPRSPATDPQPRYRWLIMSLISALDMGIILAAFSFGVLLPDMSKDLDMSPVQAGWLGSIFWMAIALFSLPFSIFLSRLSPRWISTIVALSAGLFLILQGLAANYWLEFLSRALFVSIAVARFQAAILLTQQWFEIKEMVKVSSLQSALVALAQVGAVGLVPVLLTLLSTWRNVYFAIGVLIIVIGLFFLVFGKENVSHAYSARLASQEGTPLGALKKYPTIWIVACCQLGSALTWTAFLTFWPTFLITYRELPLGTAGFLMSLFPMGSMLGSFSSSFITGTLGLRRPLLMVTGVTLPFTYLVMVLSSEPVLLALFSFLTGFLCFTVVPIIFSYPYEVPSIKPREVAVGIALIATVTTTGGTAGPLVTGFIQQTFGSLQVALIVSTFFAVSLAIAGYFLPETGWRARRAPGIGDRNSEIGSPEV